MRRLATGLVCSVALVLVSCGDDNTPATAPPPGAGPGTLKVMTQNLYLGGDLDLLLAGGADLPHAVDQIWASVQATDFPARAKVIAAAIQAADPDVVGLQEVTLWRTQSPGDHLLVPNATTVAYDFLEILLGELRGRGLPYRVVGTVQNGDFELPGTNGTDYRLTDRDAILAKQSLPIVSVSSGSYPHFATLTIPSPLGSGTIPITIPRGWVKAELRAGGRTVRLVNTHLEAFSEAIAAQQALDLVAVAQPTAQPTIVIGDMNLVPGSAGFDPLVAPSTGLADAWSAVRDGDPGLTCCWAPDLRSGAFDKRIDVALATHELRPASATKVDETERTTSGLAPSDHAGVVVELEASVAATTTVAAASR
jgi:endonuclease/exonuclease/phosphatase family metal-dependent hydrolase